VAKSSIDSEGRMENVQFEFVELRLGNVCNVACRTCNPASSSKWRNDYDKLKAAVNFKINPYDDMEGFRWPEREDFWEDLLKHCDGVKTFYINGGEPTLIKQHFKFLERLANLGRTDVKLWYNINMTNLNEDIIELWRKFDNVKISCSIDDLGDRNEYIRYPTKWDDVMRTGCYPDGIIYELFHAWRVLGLFPPSTWRVGASQFCI
jgi:MoaA/NifB/PqqE/SkfB family radical SAM enzyme